MEKVYCDAKHNIDKLTKPQLSQVHNQDSKITSQVITRKSF